MRPLILILHNFLYRFTVNFVSSWEIFLGIARLAGRGGGGGGGGGLVLKIMIYPKKMLNTPLIYTYILVDVYLFLFFIIIVFIYG